jgi:hypothetical protein
VGFLTQEYCTRAYEVSTSKQHKKISASDVSKALELIEFADLIPPLQAELRGTLRAPHFPNLTLSPHGPSNIIHVSVYRELAKSKKVSSAAGASSSAPPARNKNTVNHVRVTFVSSVRKTTHQRLWCEE